MHFPSGKQMQLDLYLPTLSLAFEFQGEQHFFEVHAFGPQKVYTDRDQSKRQACNSLGISLIEVPFWWDWNNESLAATVRAVRPELLTEKRGTPIPSYSQYVQTLESV